MSLERELELIRGEFLDFGQETAHWTEIPQIGISNQILQILSVVLVDTFIHSS